MLSATMCSRPPLLALTGLRFLAALHVVTYHLWRFDVWEVPPLLVRFVATGPVAVTLFFVLSGFVLTYSYAKGARLRASPRAFWRARFARVYPVYALALVLSAPVAMVLWSRGEGGSAGLLAELGRGAAVAVMAQAFWPDTALAWNPPAWSISVEALFYALFPFVAPRLLALSRRSLITAAASMWVASIAPSLLYLALAPDGLKDPDYSEHAFYFSALKYHPLVRLPELLLGVVAARFYLEGFRAKWPMATLLVVVLGSAGVLLSGLVPYALWHNGLLAPLFGLALIVLAGSSSLATTALSFRALRTLGESSYALYILHVPLLYWIAGVGERRTGKKVLDDPAVAVAALLFVVLSSLLVQRFFEAPLRARLRGPRLT